LRRLQTATADMDIKSLADLQQFPVVARIGD